MAVVNKETSKKFAALVEDAASLLPLMPWGQVYEKDEFKRPDFTALEVPYYMHSLLHTYAHTYALYITHICTPYHIHMHSLSHTYALPPYHTHIHSLSHTYALPITHICTPLSHTYALYITRPLPRRP